MTADDLVSQVARASTFSVLANLEHSGFSTERVIMVTYILWLNILDMQDN